MIASCSFHFLFPKEIASKEQSKAIFNISFLAAFLQPRSDVAWFFERIRWYEGVCSTYTYSINRTARIQVICEVVTR